MVHYIYILGALAPNGILSDAVFTLRPSLAFWYIGSVTARHWSSGRQRRDSAGRSSSGVSVPHLLVVFSSLFFSLFGSVRGQLCRLSVRLFCARKYI